MLNSAQSLIVEDNHNLIYAFINKNSLEESEWYGIIAESLIKAVLSHDCSKGKLSTLFFRIAKNDLINEKRKKIDMLSLYNNLEVDLAYEVDYAGNVYSDILDNLVNRERVVADMLIEGYNQREISELLNLSHMTISREVSKIRLKIRGGSTLCSQTY